jgi:hypothetical protein
MNTNGERWTVNRTENGDRQVITNVIMEEKWQIPNDDHGVSVLSMDT